ncbi:MAG: hypothetical protein HWE26_20415 [Alteromonadaceae bacterium]|nr:hypothetical protein [Alteromonadaceae bacterium]
MTFFRYTLIIFVCIFLTACSNLAFNERYKDTKWSSIVVTPVTNSFGTEITNILEHNLTTTENMIIYSPKYVVDNFGNEEVIFDTKKMKIIAKDLGADGILVTESSSSETKAYASDMGVGSSRAVVFYRLIDARTGLTVATSNKEEVSIFSDSRKLVENAAISALEDIKTALQKLSN